MPKTLIFIQNAYANKKVFNKKAKKLCLMGQIVIMSHFTELWFGLLHNLQHEKHFEAIWLFFPHFFASFCFSTIFFDVSYHIAIFACCSFKAFFSCMVISVTCFTSHAWAKPYCLFLLPLRSK